MARKIFFSFHFDNDVFRVQQIRNMGVVDDSKLISVPKWEEIKVGGQEAIRRWIDNTMEDCDCVIVLIGSETTDSSLVDYEIRKAWETKKGLFGIYIHDLKDPRTGKCRKGANPFDKISFTDGTKLSSHIRCYGLDSNDAYGDIKANIVNLVEIAIQERK